MRHIRKASEPAALRAFRLEWPRDTPEPRYKNAPEGLVKELRDALRLEQRGLCAYCMCRLTVDSRSQIEHYDAQSASDHKASLRWTNLLLVCDGSKLQGPKHEHCDASRKNKPLTLTPLDPNVEKRLRYSPERRILPMHASAESVTADLDTLKLNRERLRVRREQAVDGKIKELTKRHGCEWSRHVLERTIEDMEAQDPQPAYSGAILWYLRQRLARARA
jgi:uncharacterized protein (TIGR02646 family)